MSEQEIMLKVRCPKCGKIFEFPESDKVNVILFNNYEKYHKCSSIPKVLEWDI